MSVKHPLSTTAILLILFLAVQLIGLTLISMAIPVVVDSETGTITTAAPETPLGPPPDTNPWQTVLMIVIGVVIGTVGILVLARFKKHNWWRIWYMLAAGMTMTVSFGVVTGPKWYTLVGIVAFIVAWFKVFRPNPIVHNLSEVFIYPGIAIIFYHILSIPVMLALLAFISAYDIYAVQHSKHMIKLAMFQADSKVFAGLSIPRASEKTVKTPHQKTPHQKSTTKGQILRIPTSPKRRKTAILGGGDVAFPLLFSAVVLEDLILGGATKTVAVAQTFIISITTMLALGVLFFLAKKDKFYPAMPIVTLGCLVGWGIILLL